jgi:hypothetical protein
MGLKRNKLYQILANFMFTLHFIDKRCSSLTDVNGHMSNCAPHPMSISSGILDLKTEHFWLKIEGAMSMEANHLFIEFCDTRTQ